MTVAEALAGQPLRIEPLPRIYLACPLTNLSVGRRGNVGLTLEVVRATVEAVTFGDHADGDSWPVSLYAPYDHSAPWKEDGLSPAGVHERNLSALLDSDGLIVVADEAASAGVGQEIEWASRAGIPVLYLATGKASRQIAGTPADIVCVAYGEDIATMKAQLANWLRPRRSQFYAGPRRRANRALRYAAVTSRLNDAWRASRDPTGTAARCGLHPNFISNTLAHPARVALLAADTLSLLCAELEVRLPGATAQLNLRQTRAWLLATESAALDQHAAERLRMLGLAAQQHDPGIDLETPTAWIGLHARHA